jgi:stage V sporulation protein G
LNITEVRVKLMRNRSDRLRAFCSITIDENFVVHDLRVIEGRKGFFVAMPSRKLTDNCPRCGGKNQLRSKFCSDCGARLDEGRQKSVKRDKVHVDVAHPINTDFREMLQETVLTAYQEEAAKSEEAATDDADADYYGGDEYEQQDEGPEEECLDEARDKPEDEYLDEARDEGAEFDRVTAIEEAADEPSLVLEESHPDILEKDEEIVSVLESALAEDELLLDGIEDIEYIEEVEEARILPAFELPPAPEAEPPVAEQPQQEEEEDEEEEEGEQEQEAQSPSPLRRRTPRQGQGGGFGEGIL